MDRSELMEQFCPSLNLASAGLIRYAGLLLVHTVNDKTSQTYDLGPDYGQHFFTTDISRCIAELRSLAHGVIGSEDTWIAELSSYGTAPSLALAVDPVAL